MSVERGAKTLILGLVVGAASVILAVRLKQLVAEMDSGRLSDRLQDDMDALEQRLKGKA
ncbi:hypothetical protein BH11ARM1_BH11ARM1_11010 [soil metagenome]